MSIYLRLTREFNAGRLWTIVCSGQAVVLLRLAVASKDGDWISREDQEALDHVLVISSAMPAPIHRMANSGRWSHLRAARWARSSSALVW